MMSSSDDHILDGILPAQETSDMAMVSRLRTIINNQMTDVAKRLINEFDFWYTDRIYETSQVYWSENHYIMNCSSELLLREYLGLDVSKDLYERVDTFLALKSTMGFSEFLSPVYLPFTIASLLNIYDLSRYQAFRTMSQRGLDMLATQFMSVSLLDGSMVSPSGRSYARHRATTRYGHTALFIDYVRTLQRPANNPGDAEMALRSTLSTTKWVPSDEVYKNFKVGPVDVDIQLSPRWDDLIYFLDGRKPRTDVYVSTLWSHGLYFPVSYPLVLKVLQHMDGMKLWMHPHFKAISGVRGFLKFVATAEWAAYLIFLLATVWVINSFALAGRLTDSKVRIHREGKVILSSLINYNAGLPCFQQWPWAVNLNGIPIWCGFGPVSTAGLSAMGNKHASSEISTARVMPYMYQEGGRLVARYHSKNVILGLVNMRLAPSMRWPTDAFDETGTHVVDGSTWTWGRSSTAVIAYKIAGKEVVVVVRDLEVAGMTLSDFLGSIQNFTVA